MTTARCPYCLGPFEPEPARAASACPHCGRAFEVFVVPLPAADSPSESLAPGAVPVAISETARCANHPDNPARRTCARCGDYVCDVCATPIEGRFLCVRCFELKDERGELRSAQESFGTPNYSLVLGICSVVLGWFYCLGLILGPIAIVLGIVSLHRIREKPALPGRGKAIAGVILGALGVLAVMAFWLIIMVLILNREK